MKIKLWLLFYILNVPVSERGNEVSGKYQLLARKLKEEKNSSYVRQQHRHQGLSLENELPHEIQSPCSGIWTTNSQAKLEILKAVQVEYFTVENKSTRKLTTTSPSCGRLFAGSLFFSSLLWYRAPSFLITRLCTSRPRGI